MEAALRLLGALLVVDLAVALALVALVAIVGRDGKARVPFAALRGALLMLAACAALIYGGLWLVLRVI